MKVAPTATFAVLVILCLASLVSGDKPIYRGVATDAWSGGCADINALSRMSWYYNWGLTV
jgi:hypothetical protein